MVISETRSPSTTSYFHSSNASNCNMWCNGRLTLRRCRLYNAVSTELF